MVKILRRLSAASCVQTISKPLDKRILKQLNQNMHQINDDTWSIFDTENPLKFEESRLQETSDMI